eukprot:IDg4290t1
MGIADAVLVSVWHPTPLLAYSARAV